MLSRKIHKKMPAASNKRKVSPPKSALHVLEIVHMAPNFGIQPHPRPKIIVYRARQRIDTDDKRELRRLLSRSSHYHHTQPIVEVNHVDPGSLKHGVVVIDNEDLALSQMVVRQDEDEDEDEDED